MTIIYTCLFVCVFSGNSLYPLIIIRAHIYLYCRAPTIAASQTAKTKKIFLFESALSIILLAVVTRTKHEGFVANRITTCNVQNAFFFLSHIYNNFIKYRKTFSCTQIYLLSIVWHRNWTVRSTCALVHHNFEVCSNSNIA